MYYESFIPSKLLAKFRPEKRKPGDLTIEGNLHLPVTLQTSLIGEYPRRVSIGDPILSNVLGTLPSPANGIATFKPEIQQITIQQDGAWEKHPHPVDTNIHSKNIADLLDKQFVLNLDSDQPILFSKTILHFLENPPKSVILSPFTRTNLVDYQDIILKTYSNELNQLVQVMKKLFPQSLIHNDIAGNENASDYHHLMGIPDYYIFSKKYGRVEDYREGKAFFLGAETIYHLLRGLFLEIPFTKRHLSVCIASKKEKKINFIQTLFLSNGQSLHFIPQKNGNKFPYFSFRYVYDKPELLEFNKSYYFDISLHSNLVLFEFEPETHLEFPCTTCMECSYSCPTFANPFALLTPQSMDFKNNYCIDCGICTMICPSGIDLRNLIKQNKQKVGIS